MMFKREIPPTAGLPMHWRDWLPTGADICANIAHMFKLPPLQLECSGTAALIVALKTLSAMPENRGRREVVIPAYSCPLVVLAIAWCGLRPRLCDTVYGGFDFDPTCLEAIAGPRTLAVMPTHLGGQLADAGRCARLARKCGAYVIEDAAQALGAAVGQHGDIVFFSLAVGKGLTLYEGGLLTARTEDMRQALRRKHDEIVPSRWFYEAGRLAELFAYTAAYRPFLLHWAYGKPRRAALAKGDLLGAVGDVFDAAIPLHRVSRLRARRGASAAARLPDFLSQTRKQAVQRIGQLKRIGQLEIPGADNPDAGVWPFLMVVLPDAPSRDLILEKLWSAPLGVSRLFIHALAHYSYLKPCLGKQKATPNADDFASRMLTITNSPWLAQADFNMICKVISETL